MRLPEGSQWLREFKLDGYLSRRRKSPQFVDDMADMPENQNFYILEHGIRWTAMPGWKNVLTVQQTWQIVTFLSHMNDLSPAAKQVFTETASRTQQPSDSH